MPSPVGDDLLCEVLERLDVLREQLVTAPAAFADLVIAALLAEVGVQLVAGRIRGQDATEMLRHLA